jgi:phage protein D
VAADLTRLIPDCRVSLSGQALALEEDAALTQVQVDLDVELFAQCVLVFADPQMALINGDRFQAGTAVSVELGFDNKRKPIFQGEVVALEPQFRRDLPISLRVVCHETLHRLALTTMTRSFQDVDDGEIVKQVAQEHGLSSEGPSGTKEHVLQQNSTDALFLRRLAQKQGNHLRIEGKKLILGGPPDDDEIPISAIDGLRKATVKIKAGSQIKEVVVQGYDPKTKQGFVGKAQGEGETGKGAQTYGGSASLVFAGHEHQPVDIASAEAMAKGRMRKLAEGFITTQMEMAGNPQVVPGAKLKLDKVHPNVDGTWRVAHALHDFSKRGYWVKFRAVKIAKAQPPKPVKQPKAQPASEGPPPDLHLVILTVKTIGGTPLSNHPVRVVDRKTGEPVSDVVKTDDQGVMRAEVDAPGDYRVVILDRAADSTGPDLGTSAPAATLACHFVGTDGGPIANEEVDVKTGGDSFKLTTDADGRIDAPATLGSYELTLRGETFQAHAVPASEAERGLHEFVVGEEKHDLHLLVLQVKGIGDTPLVNRSVRVLDPDNGEVVTDWLTTDDGGYLRTEVPDDRTYRVEIGDEALEHQGPELGTSAPAARLSVQLVSPGGVPLANQDVSVTCGEDTFTLTTDENGRIDAPAQLEAYQLKVGDETFLAHGVPSSDADAEKGLHQFVIGEEQHDRHLLSILVKSIGDTPLPDHRVRVRDPDTGDVLGDWVLTGDDGMLNTEVPDDRTYRIEIDDRDAPDAGGPELDPGKSGGLLVCVFTDASGAPVANETVTSDDLTLQTDASGRLEAAASLSPYQLTIRGQTFSAHGQPADDAEKEENVYRFVLEG